jgi:hypothetical protein
MYHLLIDNKKFFGRIVSGKIEATSINNAGGI